MTQPLDVSALTPDDHLATLVEMERSLQAAGAWLNKLRPCEPGTLKLRRAAAIRWILSETAHGVEPGELAV